MQQYGNSQTRLVLVSASDSTNSEEYILHNNYSQDLGSVYTTHTI